MSNSCIGIVSYHKQENSYIFTTNDIVGHVTDIRLETTSNQVSDNVSKNVFISINTKEYDLSKINRFKFKLDFIVGNVFYEVKYNSTTYKYEFKEAESGAETVLDASELFNKLNHLIFNIN